MGIDDEIVTSSPDKNNSLPVKPIELPVLTESDKASQIIAEFEAQNIVRQERIRQLFAQPVIDETTPPPTRDEFNSRFQQYLEDHETTGLEKLNQQNLLLLQAERLQQQNKQIDRAITGAWQNKHDSIDILAARIRVLRRSPVSRVLKHFEIKQLEQQWHQQQQDLNLIVNNADSQSRNRDALILRRKELSEQHHSVIAGELRREVQECLQSYEQLDQLTHEPTFITQLQNEYIRKFITSEAEQYLSPRIIEKDKEKIKTGLEATIKAVLTKNGIPSREKRTEITKYREAYGLFMGSELDDQAEFLMMEGVEKTIKVLTSRIVAQKTKELLNLVPNNSEGNTLKNEEEARVVNFILDRGFQTTVESIIDLAQNSGVKTWSIIRDSPLLTANFPEIIKDCDDECYKIALDKALEVDSTSYVSALEYFPRPETIRNLILMQAADTGGNRVNAAIGTYSRLTKNPDWEKIVNEAAAVYPEIKPIADILKPWEGSIMELVTPLALETIKQNPDDKRLCSLARSTLTTEQLINLAFTPDQALQVNTAIEIMHQKAAEIGVEANTFLNIDLRLRSKVKTIIDSRETNDNYSNKISNRLNRYCKTIIDNQNNQPLLTFISLDRVLNKLMQDNFTEQDVDAFLAAAIVCPQLATDFNLVDIFFNNYQGPDTSQFFQKMTVAYQGYETARNDLIRLVYEKGFDRQRAIELPQKAGEIFTDANFQIVLESPLLFLTTDEGLQLFKDLSTKGLFNLKPEQENQMGQNFVQMRQNTTERNKFNGFILNWGIIEQKIAQNLLIQDIPIEINETNWAALLTAYVREHAIIPQTQTITDLGKIKLEELFNQPQAKNEILRYFKKAWLTYLIETQADRKSYSLSFLTEIIHSCGGAAVLSQLDALGGFARNVDMIITRSTTEKTIQNSILSNLTQMESRFDKERWSEEDRRQFYNVSRDIISADANLFNEFLDLLSKLPEKDTKRFIKEIYPLYRTQLVLLEKGLKQGIRQFEQGDLDRIKTNLREFAEHPKKNYATHKQHLTSELNRTFKDRFGIVKIPSEMTDEDIRSINDASQYLASLHNRDSEKEAILGFYLALNLNKKWREFREGNEIKPTEFLTVEKALVIDNYLSQRKNHNVLTAENIGISQDQLPEFLEILEQETQNFATGSIETVDIKLNNILLNLHRLEDPDLYPTLLDQERYQIVRKWGDKAVSSVVAKMYQQLNRPREISFTDDEEQIRKTIATSLSKSNITLSTKTLKEHFQDGLKPFTLVVNLLNTATKNNAEAEIERLKELTKPSPEIITLFNRLGEQFSPTSGALALSHDLSYLDTLVVKREDEFNTDERALVIEYVSQIRQQLSKLEQIFQEMRTKIQGVKPDQLKANPQLMARLTEISQIATNNQERQTVNSGLTSDLNMIIENMRECLSCTMDGFNNDTNLTFGDINKFYLYSQKESLQGTIADEILFFVPITTQSETTMSFVLDRLYGTNTPFVLENHVQVVLKKAQVLKQKFPQTKLSVFIPLTTISSSGSIVDTFISQLSEKSYKTTVQSSVEIDVPPSAGGDHYIEFGGEARRAGKRQVMGVLISL